MKLKRKEKQQEATFDKGVDVIYIDQEKGQAEYLTQTIIRIEQHLDSLKNNKKQAKSTKQEHRKEKSSTDKDKQTIKNLKDQTKSAKKTLHLAKKQLKAIEEVIKSVENKDFQIRKDPTIAEELNNINTIISSNNNNPSVRESQVAKVDNSFKHTIKVEQPQIDVDIQPDEEVEEESVLDENLSGLEESYPEQEESEVFDDVLYSPQDELEEVYESKKPTKKATKLKY